MVEYDELTAILFTTECADMDMNVSLDLPHGTHLLSLSHTHSDMLSSFSYPILGWGRGKHGKHGRW